MKNKNIIPKLTDFELATIFQSRVYLIKIDGNLHFLNGCYFQKLDPKSLETLILETLRAELHTMSSSKVQRVAYILNTQYSPLYFPAELEGWRGFSNGIWNCFSGAFYPYPLQQICPITFYFNNIPFFNPTDQIPTPVADSFFNCIAGNDPSLVNRIWEMIGYILVPDARAKVFFLLQGLPNSGKSVLGRFIEGFFSPGRVTSLDISQLGAKYFPEAMFDSFLNLSMDVPNKKLPLGAVARIKMMTGDDLTTYEPKFKEARPYRGLGKLLFATNHTLKLHEWDQAFVNRIVCIPFNHSIPAEAQDRNLLSKLEYERANIAMKAISQYINLRLNNYQFSGNFRPLIDCQPSDNEIICEFVNKKCRLVPHDEGKTHSSVLFKAYINFCKENGYTPLTAMDGFSQRLQNNFNGKIFSSRWRENGQNANGYMGIILRNPQYLEGPVVARFQI